MSDPDKFTSVLVFGLCTFAGGLRWKEQWFNSGERTHLLLTQPDSPVIFRRGSSPILPIVDIRERGFTACRCKSQIFRPVGGH